MKDQEWDGRHLSYPPLHILQSIDQSSSPAKPGPPMVDQRVLSILLHLGNMEQTYVSTVYWEISVR